MAFRVGTTTERSSMFATTAAKLAASFADWGLTSSGNSGRTPGYAAKSFA